MPSTQPFPHVLLRLFMTLQRSSPGRRSLALAAIGALLLAGSLLTYATGGTRTAILHILYLPITLSAFVFGVQGGLLAGFAAMLALGFVPLDVATGETQLLGNILLRGLFFTAVGGTIGSFVDILRAQLEQDQETLVAVESSYAKTLKNFARILEERDKQTRGHCERVALNARTLGQALGFSDDLCDSLYWAGVLHDLGKIGVPETILLKPAALTDAERRLVERHAALGAELVQTSLEDFSLISAGIRTHHERWDGSGYPDGLEGEGIPLFGRILAIMDVFEALTSHRPYRDAMTLEAALAHLEAQAGRDFDPALMTVFLRLYGQGKILTETPADPIMPPLVPRYRQDGVLKD